MRFKRLIQRSVCLSLVFGISTTAFSQQLPWDKGQTFTEAADPVASDGKSWQSVKPGLHTSFASIDKRFPKSEAPGVTVQRSQHLKGWKGERLSAQVLLWTADSIPDVKVSVSDPVSRNGKTLGPVAYARFERYIITDTYGPGCGWRKPGDFPASLSPDMLDDCSSYHLERKKVRPVWITIDIPRDAAPGVYAAKVAITSPNGKKQELDLTLDVIGLTIPAASDWVFHLDQWQHPSAIARVNNVPVWSDAHFKAMEPQMKMLARLGQKVITATLNKDPWHVQTLDPYEDMIIWTKEKDGSWSYNYQVFDKWVAFMMDLGIKKMINCYSIVPWNNEIHYKDAATGKFVNVVAKPGTPAFTEMWEPFLKDFVRHLRQKGWLEITNIALDERNKDEMGLAFALIEKASPALSVSYADNQKTYQRYPNSRDVSTAVQHPIDSKDLADRTARGLNTTFYVYCGNNFPNQFTFSDPAESAYMGWYAMAAGYNGVLRWAFNSWVENPLVDSRFRTWPAGDTYIVYPQARSSIRYERLLEGIQDYEKIRAIKKMLEEKKDKAQLAALDAAIAQLNNNKRHDGWNDDLNAAKKLLNELSASLAK
ncbi:glycoside hydrolase domain-containing protein [Chitinophaga pollutisoli]|uniref:Glycoside hydrolase domain-containing protein n=1 Tax=Chitinophaga pollutisoli TaxID=3133966 RepID=A0ABZ2YSN3_9BACT